MAGILLKYDQKKKPEAQISGLKKPASADNLSISFIGAGSFAQNSLIPNIPSENLVSVATAEGHNGRSVAQKFGFRNALSSGEAVAAEKDSNTIFIATRHDTHFKYVMEGLQNHKNVFVEKPLCMTIEELEMIRQTYQVENVHLMVGFNRRFSPHILQVKKMLNPAVPVAINYRINAGFIPPDHWTQDPRFGGGRIIGEVCHFIDLSVFLAGALPATVHALAMKEPMNMQDVVTISLAFTNGSIATIQYLSNGSKEMKKEYLEVFSSGTVMIVDDFKSFEIIGKSRKTTKLMNQDKGHKEEVRQYLAAIRSGSPTPIPFREIYASTYTTFMVLDSIRENRAIDLDFSNI